LLALLLGFLWSLRLAQRAAQRLYRRRAWQGFWPWALVFLALVLVAWQIFAMPMEMRGMPMPFG